MEQITIDRDFPPPPPAQRGRRTRFPFRDLGVGDSFWSPTPTMHVKPWEEKTGNRFTCRRENRDGITGTRVWRIA